MSSPSPRTERPILKVLSRVLDGAGTVFLVISIGSLASIMLLITLDVILRNAFNFPLPITIPYVEILLAGTVAGAVTYTQQLNGHVAADIVTTRLPETVARWTLRVGNLVAIAALATIAFTTSTIAVNSFIDGEKRQGLVPVEMWPGRALIAAAFIVLTLLVIRNLYRDITNTAEVQDNNGGPSNG